GGGLAERHPARAHVDRAADQRGLGSGLEQWLGDAETPPAGDERDVPPERLARAARTVHSCRSSSATATSRASSRGVSGSSLARTSGFTPSPASDTPSAVKYSPTVMSRAPPAGRWITSWKVPLP